MLDVDQNYGTPETPKPFPTFKECVAQDVQNVIFNSNEFAEERYIDDKLMLCITQHPCSRRPTDPTSAYANAHRMRTAQRLPG